ncbi:MAG: S9 family peptidase [Inhella sp.]|uniref:S9 family peptidase n=1 Tax=Inhella sp. TaxID=1921806 RepID=UPI00391B1CC5
MGGRGWRAWVRGALLSACVVATGSPVAAEEDGPPVALKLPRDVSIHGDRRVDDYFWLRERDNPAVMWHLRAEAAYTERWYAARSGLVQTLLTEMTARVPAAERSEPVRQAGWWIGTRIEPGQQYPAYVRQRAAADGRWSAEAPVQTMLDLNELARGRAYLAVPEPRMSPDGRLLQYGIDDSGARDHTLRVRDLSTGRDWPWQVSGGDGQAAWAADSRTLFYVTTDAAKRSHRLWRQTWGAQPSRPVLVFEERDPLFNLVLQGTDDGRYLMLTSAAKDRNEVRVLRSDRPTGPWQRLLPRQAGRELRVEHHQGQWLLLANDRGPQFRLLRWPVQRPLRHWADLGRAEEWVAHRDDTLLEGLTVFQTHVAVQVRSGGSVGQRLLPVAGGPAVEVDFGQTGNFTAMALVPGDGTKLGLNRDPALPWLRVQLQSQTQPPAVVDVDLATARPTIRRVREVPGYDASRYATERLWATAADGTRIPVSLVYAKAPRLGGPQPLLLKGYGAYGLPSDPRFSSVELSLLDRGVIVAIAHVRGGGDLGRPWYHAGKLDRKMNSFTDFVAVAEHLVAQGYTRPEQLAATGGSAGGVLMGAVVNLRRDLFRAVVAEVAFLDVINTMLDETLPLTTEEFIEWGNPKKPQEYAWMRAYSPYDNLQPGAYPAMLLTTGLNDSQVPYWEPAKYVAKLRTLKTDTRLLLFDIDLQVGHGGASGRFDQLKGEARTAAFLLTELGVAGAP